MNRFTSLAFLLLITANGLFSEKNSSAPIRLLNYYEDDSRLRSENSEQQSDLLRLKDLRISREMLYRSKNPLTIANGLRHLNMCEREIISNYSPGIKTKNLQYISNPATPTNAATTGFLTDLKFNYPGMKKTAFQGVMKHQLDSFINETNVQNVWQKTNKNHFIYDKQGRMTAFHEYEADFSGTWKEVSKGMMSYNNYGIVTQTENWEWNDAVSQWYLNNKMVMDFNEKQLPVLVEIYAGEYNPDSARFITAGQSKTTISYDDKGMPDKIIFYDWDAATAAWIPETKNEMKVENEQELLFASYHWDRELKMWIGEWKFEHIPIPGYELMDYIHYGWNPLVNDWYITMKEENLILHDTDGLRVMKNNYEANDSDFILRPINRDVYTKPFQNNYFSAENFRLIMRYKYNPEINNWVNTYKTENTFDAGGIITLSSEFEWLFTSGLNTHSWIETTRVEQTIGTGNTIQSSTQHNWAFNPQSGNYEPAWRDNYQFSYQQIGEVYFLNGWVKQSQNTGSIVWENAEKYNATLNNTGLVVSEVFQTYDLGTGKWTPNRKAEYDYNYDGSYSLYATYGWNFNTENWQLSNKSEYYIDQYDRVLKESNSTFSHAVNQVIINNFEERAYLGGPEDERLTMEAYINTSVQYDGQNFFAVVNGYKNEWNYEKSGDKVRLMSGTGYYYANDQFIPEWKATNTYHSNYFEAVVQETFYDYNSITSSWEVESKGEVSYNFNIQRENMVLPFTDNDEDSYKFFHYMPTGYVEYEWDIDTSIWIATDRNLIFFSESEFSANNAVNGNQLYVYPNPAKDYLYIPENAYTTGSELTIRDIQGKVMIRQILTESGMINLTGLTNGIYFYQMSSNGNTISGKFIKE